MSQGSCGDRLHSPLAWPRLAVNLPGQKDPQGKPGGKVGQVRQLSVQFPIVGENFTGFSKPRTVEACYRVYHQESGVPGQKGFHRLGNPRLVLEILGTKNDDSLRGFRAHKHTLQPVRGEGLVRIQVVHFEALHSGPDGALHAKNSLARGGFAVDEADLLHGKATLDQPVQTGAPSGQLVHERNPSNMSRTLHQLDHARWEKELPTHKLHEGYTLLVEGPATVRVEEGDSTCLGAPLSKNTWTTVREERQLPLETETGASIEVKLGGGGRYEEVRESTIPPSWREASQIARQSPGLVTILGDVDSGKSTLCTFLANECLKHGIKVSVIDADIGQADIGPPATINLSRVKHHIFTLQDLSPETSLFMGDTSPSSIAAKLSRGLVRLRDATRDAEVLLVNTDGWVRGHDAFLYKLQLLDELGPDLVYGISSDGELDQLLEHQKSTTLKLNRSLYARARTRDERKRAREYGYRRFLQNARRAQLKLGDMKLRSFNSYQQLRIGGENLRGVLVGLLDEGENLLSIGRVESLRNELLTIRTSAVETPRIVELGAVVLSPSYEELGFEP